ncbi:Asp-tRNA(Asn)/Glu-tRNA(Gln) amidotransferase subunit GatC [bacterium]|nr:Asp-tRNA(Asn)/Glu-tRNA(Gln) amidotransferase subunit GatC [bacterium]
MNLDDQKIDELAYLARLEFKQEDKEHIRNDLNRIIDFCDQLKSVDTEGVEPLVYLSDAQNVLREDLKEEALAKSEALKNAPSKDSDYFKVPKVLKKK